MTRETMKVLVVGGTGFLGGAITDAALAQGWQTDVLTRRVHSAQRRGVGYIIGDRHLDLRVLAGQHYDIVFDTCGFAPDAVESLLAALSPGIGLYAFVSSISVYDSFSEPGLDEEAPVQEASSDQLALARALPVAQRSMAGSYGAAYGPLKRACEDVARTRLGKRALVLRSGLLVGAGDYTDRLTWWVRRIDSGGRVAAPGRRDRPVQLIDVRDAAAFAVSHAAAGGGGVFNLTGRTFPFECLLDACRDAAGADADFVWRSDQDVLAAGLAPWTEVPLWLPENDTDLRHFLNLGVERVFAAGLVTRPLRDTLLDLLAWDRGRRDVSLKAGMPLEKEALLLG